MSQTNHISQLISQLSIEEKVSQLMFESLAIEHAGIPEYNWWNECLHGVARAGRATVFPQAIMLAATFNPELAFEVANAISDEARAKHNAAQKNGYRKRHSGLTFWTPNINIFRDPRWGRGQETYGEDPVLTSIMASAFVKGLQGDNPHFLKLAACAKHFAVHSGPEKIRHSFDAKVSEKDLHETYLPAFKALVDIGVEAIMCAYNRVNGDPCCGHKTLVSDILRKQWNYKNHILSDGFALPDLHGGHGITENEYQSAVYAMNNGIDLDIGVVYKNLTDAVKKGDVPESRIDEALQYIFTTRQKLGILQYNTPTPWDSVSESVIDCEKHRNLALQVAQQGIVLLHNKQNTLPLKKDIQTLYVTGPNASNVDALLGNYYGINPRMVTILEGIAGKVSAATMFDYKPGFQLNQTNINPIDWMIFDARQADAVIAVIGLQNVLEGEEGEAIMSDEYGDRSTIDIPVAQLEHLKKIRSKYDGKLIAVICSGSPLNLSELCEIADAVVWAWYPGEEGGTAVADVIFGDISPSGKLPVTFPTTTDQLPLFEDYSIKNRTYRYMNEAAQFRFGFGLSYTQWQLSDISLSGIDITNASISASVTLTNTGTIPADEVVQLYISSPQAGITNPYSSLKQFKRVHVAANESQTIQFTLTKHDFLTIDDNGKEILLTGKHNIHIGNCSPGKQTQSSDSVLIKTISIELK